MENSRGYEGLRDFDLWMAAAGIELAPSTRIKRTLPGKPFVNTGRGATLLA
jgi:hypothetical protein